MTAIHDPTLTLTSPETWLGPQRAGAAIAERELDLTPPRWESAAFDDRYRIERQIGVGGMGRVMLVEDRLLGRQIAMKLPIGRYDPSYPRRLVAEARLGARLDHPGVVRVYDVGQDPSGQLFFTMELLQGKPLDLAMTSLSRVRRIEALIRVGEVIAVAHRAGVVHRDLKPRNILVSSDGDVRVLDWGIAAEIGAVAPPAGTPGYASPGQMAGKPATIQDDLHALGVMVSAVLSEPHAATAAVAAFAREGRYPDVAAMLDDLRALWTGDPLRARPDRPWDPLLRHVRRYVARYTGFAALTLLFLALAAAAAWRQSAALAEENARLATAAARAAAITTTDALLERRDYDAAALEIGPFVSDPETLGRWFVARHGIEPRLIALEDDLVCEALMAVEADRVVCGGSRPLIWDLGSAARPWDVPRGSAIHPVIGMKKPVWAWSTTGSRYGLPGLTPLSPIPFPADAAPSSGFAVSEDGVWYNHDEGVTFLPHTGEPMEIELDFPGSWVAPAPDGAAIVGSFAHMSRVDPTGQIRWRRPSTGDVAVPIDGVRFVVAGGPAGSDGRVSIHDAETGEIVSVMHDLPASVHEITSGGGRVAALARDGRVYLSDGKHDAWLAGWSPFPDQRKTPLLRIDDRGEHLAVAHSRRGIALWELPPASRLPMTLLPGPALGVVWEGDAVWVPLRDQGLFRIDATGATQIDPRPGEGVASTPEGLWRGLHHEVVPPGRAPLPAGSMIYGLLPHPGGGVIAWGQRQQVSWWDADGRLRWTFSSIDKRPSVMGAAVHPERDLLAWTSSDQRLHLATLNGGAHLTTTEDGAPFYGVAFSSDGQHLYAAATVSQEVASPSLIQYDLRDPQKPTLIARFTTRASCASVTAHPNGRVLAGDNSGNLYVLTPDLEPIAIAKIHRGEIRQIALHPDGERFATASSDGSVRFWDLRRLTEPRDPAIAAIRARIGLEPRSSP